MSQRGRKTFYRIFLGTAVLILGLVIIWTLAEVVIRLYFTYNDRKNPYIEKDLRKNATIS